MNRYPVVAGTFYPSSPQELRQAIDDTVKSPLGPGPLNVELPVLTPLSRNLAVIVPHAGYIYSGPVAACAYAEVAKRGKPDLVILLGPNHTARGAKVGVWNQGQWITPFGEVKVDKEAAQLLFEHCEVCQPDFNSHLMEHSLEVQVPFLQYFFEKFKILPISLFPVSVEICQKLAAGLDIVVSRYRRVLLVVSTDLNHYENQSVTVRKDSLVIEMIKSKDPFGLIRVVVDEKISMCGVSPVVSLLFMKAFGQPVLLCHATSGDVSGNFTQVVGYASFICEAI